MSANNAQVQRTSDQYDAVIARCRDLYAKKFKDYGASWRIMRPGSITDQIFIKANRIRSLQEKGENRVGEGILGEFIAIVNYGVMGVLQLRMGPTDTPEEDERLVLDWYDRTIAEAKQLMEAKNHDYDEAWRSLRIPSITDLILSKIFRTKQIEENKGTTIVSEGIDANYLDMVNYAIFALILMEEEQGRSNVN